MIRTAPLTVILTLLLLAAGFEPAVAYTHRFTSIHYPDSLETMISDINDAGQAAGYYRAWERCSWTQEAFLHSPGMLTDLDFPPSSRRSRHSLVIPLGINSEGTVVGMQVNPRNLKTRSFIYEAGELRFLGPYRRGLNYIGGINDEGHMTGYSSKLGAYLYDGTTLTPISYSFPLFPMDLNISDQVVGFYFGGDRRAHGFFYDEGSVLTIDYPGAAGTFLTGINDDGLMTGWYRDGGSSYDFIATPVPIPGSIWLLAAGLLSLSLTLRSSLRQGNPSPSPSPNTDERSS